MKIKCRAKISKDCYDGNECKPVYGEDRMDGDGTWDRETDTVVCDPCYIKGGQPSVSYPASREEIVEHVDREMGLD